MGGKLIKKSALRGMKLAGEGQESGIQLPSLSLELYLYHRNDISPRQDEQ
jgi:hypothetical protein